MRLSVSQAHSGTAADNVRDLLLLPNWISFSSSSSSSSSSSLSSLSSSSILLLAILSSLSSLQCHYHHHSCFFDNNNNNNNDHYYYIIIIIILLTFSSYCPTIDVVTFRLRRWCELAVFLFLLLLLITSGVTPLFDQWSTRQPGMLSDNNKQGKLRPCPTFSDDN